MTKITLCFLAMAMLVLQSYAQTWVDNPNYKDLLAQVGDPTQKYVNVLDERILTFKYLPTKELAEDVFYHQQYYLNSPEAIDGFNKIYIPLAANVSLLDYNARVISPSGTVRVLSQDDLKEAVNEAGNNVKFFALSGVEMGGVIEFYYKIRRNPNLTGNVLYFQKTAPTVKASFTLVSPKNLVFKSLSLNGFATLKEDTFMTDKETNVLHLEQLNMPGLKEEKFCNSDAYAMGVLFQLYENRYTGARNIYNYGTASQSVFESLNQEPSKGELKSLQKLLNLSEYGSAKTTREKIQRIEDYVKRNFFFTDGSGPEFANLETVLEKKAVNDNAAARLLYSLYKLAGINTEIVITCDRSSLKFDSNFESYAFLNDYIFYFPDIDDYLVPSLRYMRLGLIPSGNLGNNGLFIKKVALGGIESGAGVVRKIKQYPAEHTTNNMKVNVTFNEAADVAEINTRVNYTGFYAAGYQPVYSFIEEAKIKEFNQEIVNSLYANAEAEDIVIENQGVENLMVQPFVVSFHFSSPEFIEKAGNKVLFKVGELIGPQAEMYQEGERQFPVENDFNRLYKRELIVNVPAGYTCKNPEILSMLVQPFKGKKDEAGFVSNYKQEGNKITVTISEYYNSIFLPKEDYESYRQVINAAADFNKLVLVLEKI